VGIIGLPNAGKSTLISALSSARPKIAGYPFTTLTPTLGVVKFDDGETIVMADIPGLIEGAHQGAGMGIQFLRHIERTRILVHLIDVSAIDPDHPLHSLQTVNDELAQYSPALAEKPQLVVLNKMDIEGADQLADGFRHALAHEAVQCISAAGRNGLEALMTRIRQLLVSLNEKS
jgi:GTP-binding protein